MPILGDLYEILKENPLTTRLATIVSRFVTGSAQSFNRQTNVNLDNKYVVLDISELKGKLLPVGMMIALDYVWDQVKADRTRRKMVFIDEIWKLIGGSANRQAAEFCLEIFKIIRGYGGGAVAATQDLSDFFGLEDGRAHTLEELGKEFNVTRERVRQIEAKALRKLRHPSRAKRLRDYLDE